MVQLQEWLEQRYAAIPNLVESTKPGLFFGSMNAPKINEGSNARMRFSSALARVLSFEGKQFESQAYTKVQEQLI